MPEIISDTIIEGCSKMIMILLLKIFLWVLIFVLLLIFLILILPISLELIYNGNKFDFRIKIWFLRLDSLSRRFSKPKAKGSPEKSKKENTGKKLKDIQNVAKYVKPFFTNSGKIVKLIIKSIVFKRLKFKIIVGSEEASKTATTYGLVCAAVYPVASAFIACNEPKSYDISVVPDFISGKINFFVDLKLKTRIISFLIVALKILKIIKSKLK